MSLGKPKRKITLRWQIRNKLTMKDVPDAEVIAKGGSLLPETKLGYVLPRAQAVA